MGNLDFNILEAIESLGENFYIVMKSFTTIGESRYYFAVIIVLMWCVNYRLFSRLALLIPFSGMLAESLKVVFHMPRPYQAAEQLINIQSYGMPSGHALSGVPFWGYLAYVYKKKWFKILSIFIILGIGISRVYRGSHFPSQVLAGYILGAVILFIAIKYQRRIIAYFVLLKSQTKHIILIIAASFPVILALAAMLIYNDNNGMENMIGTMSLAGLLYGILLSFYLIHKNNLKFNVRTSFIKQLIKIAVCVISLFAYYYINKYSEKLFDINFLLGSIVLITSNIFLGLWFAYYAPKLFVRFRLFSRD